eukprot:PhM_4_TR6333/c0_g1_i2/m.52513
MRLPVPALHRDVHYLRVLATHCQYLLVCLSVLFNLRDAARRCMPVVQQANDVENAKNVRLHLVDPTKLQVRFGDKRNVCTMHPPIQNAKLLKPPATPRELRNVVQAMRKAEGEPLMARGFRSFRTCYDEALEEDEIEAPRSPSFRVAYPASAWKARERISLVKKDFENVFVAMSDSSVSSTLATTETTTRTMRIALAEMPTLHSVPTARPPKTEVNDNKQDTADESAKISN